jgi:murein DD-endopeptidase MepM/ murein hydrolase activator NlpD
MKHFFFSRLCHRSGSAHLSLPLLGVCLTGVSSLLLAGGIWAGYQLGSGAVAEQQAQPSRMAQLHQKLRTQRQELDQAKRQMQRHLDALALRLGVMQSELLRLDALGELLVKKGKLDPDEFNFHEAPPRGGLEADAGTRSVELDELVAEMSQLSRTLSDRAHKLDLMEKMIISAEVEDGLEPKGRPIRNGWISSSYGYRKDPFTGKKTFHHGVDMTGKKGSVVYAVASGVVTRAETVSGYGYLVEIAHADGLITRYGHNKKIFVSAGQLVNKGERIGIMGNTGRSTGPHVHFEVVRNGKSLNPAKYLRKG